MRKSSVKVIEGFLDDQLRKGRSSGTLKTYKSILHHFSEWVEAQGGEIAHLTRVDVQNYINHLINIKGNGAATIDNKFAVLSLFAKYVNCPYVVESIVRPEVRKILHRAPKSLDRNERNRLLRDVERTGNLRNIAIVYMFLYTGLRVKELVSLDQKDITMSDRSGTMVVRRGKGDIERKIPLPSEARFHLKRYLDARTDLMEELFVSNYGQRIAIRTVQGMLKTFGIHPHQLRHTYCRELVAAGIDIAIVAELAGHSDINVTRRYSKPDEHELEQAIGKVFG